MSSDMRGLDERLAARILVLDGAMGTMIRREPAARTLTGDADALALTQPDVITAIHHAYLAAGADIITTNTFNGTALVQAGSGLESAVYELNVAASRLAKEACAQWTGRTPDKPRLVAGSIGPTNRAVSTRPSAGTAAFQPITSNALKDAYKEQVRGLLDGGCDLLLIETVFDVLNARAALAAIDEVYEHRRQTREDERLPLMLSVTVSESGRTWAGQTLDVFWTSVAHARPFCVGVNCAFGARGIGPHIAALARIADCAISCHPSAGLPDADGRYGEQPAGFAGVLADLAARGLVNIVGGCCGTTPDHIRALAAAVEGLRPRAFTRHPRRSSGVS